MAMDTQISTRVKPTRDRISANIHEPRAHFHPELSEIRPFISGGTRGREPKGAGAGRSQPIGRVNGRLPLKDPLLHSVGHVE